MGYRRLSAYRQARLDAAFAKADREAALRKQDGRCRYCLDPLTLKQVTRDHKTPRSAGGLDHKSNIAAACEPCNQTKGSIPFDTFMRLITAPRSGEPMQFRMVWVSRRLNTALIKMEKRLDKALGRRR